MTTAPALPVQADGAGPVFEAIDLGIRLDGNEILAGLTFSVRRGASLAVIGPNGSGKTALLRAMIGAIPHAGAIRWAAGVRIGYVPQKLDLARDAPLTGFDFLRARTALSQQPTSSARDVLDAVGLAVDAGARPIGALSGGQFQRLLLAFALLGSPDVLLLDEVTAGVDEPGQEQLYALIQRLRHDRGLTVILVSHDLSVVFQHATDVLCLGRTHRCFGSPREILTPDLLFQIYGTPIKFHIHER